MKTRKKIKTEMARFSEKLAWLVGSDCWRWLGARNSGYGIFYSNGVLVRAHRWSYERAIGPIPEGLVLDHLCRVRECVNPWHLDPKTIAENIRAPGSLCGKKQVRTTCRRGHAYGTTAYVNPNNGHKTCRVCMAHTTKRWEEKKRHG